MVWVLMISCKYMISFERTPQIVILVILAQYNICTKFFFVDLVQCLKYSKKFTKKVFQYHCDTLYKMFCHLIIVNIILLYFFNRTLTKSFLYINIKRCVLVEMYDCFDRHELIDYIEQVYILWISLLTLNVCLVDMCTELSKVIIWNCDIFLAIEMCVKNSKKPETLHIFSCTYILTTCNCINFSLLMINNDKNDKRY